MEKYTLNKLRDKEVINTCDGKRLGYICDAIIDICTGSVCALIVILDCRHFRFGKPEEIAQVVLQLADTSAYLTGQII